MKFDPPHGSVFGGYGFWTYSATPNSHPSAGNTSPRAPAAEPGSASSLRSLLEHARRVLRRTRTWPGYFIRTRICGSFWASQVGLDRRSQ